MRNALHCAMYGISVFFFLAIQSSAGVFVYANTFLKPNYT